MIWRIILLFCVSIRVLSISLPKITPCQEKDSVCLTRSANTIYKLTINGEPELHIQSVDPMFHKQIDGDLAFVKYKLTNSSVEGFGTCEVVDTKLDLKKSLLSLDFACPHFVMQGIYEISGRLLVLPIQGKGDYRIIGNDYHIHLDTDIKINESSNGKRYLSLKSYKVNGDLKGGFTADIKNLFNGKQKELEKAVLDFANKNSKEVAQELQGPVFNANIKKLLKNFNRYLKSIPFELLISE